VAVPDLKRMSLTSTLEAGSSKMSTMARFHYGCDGKFEEDPGDLGSVAKVQVVRRDGRLTTTAPLLKAAFQVLFDTWPRTVSFDELLGEARALLGSPEEEADRAVLGGGLLNCHASNVVEVRATPARVGGLTERPTASGWVQAQIEDNATRLTNLRHESGGAGGFFRPLLLLLDGTRDRAELVEDLVRQVQRGELTIKDPEDRPLEDVEQILSLLEDTIETALHTAVRSSMIME